MTGRLAVVVLVVLAAAWHRPASAARVTSDAGCGPPMGTTTSGFVEVIGPIGSEPEHSGNFAPPSPTPVCRSRPAPGQAPDRPSSQPAQR